MDKAKLSNDDIVKEYKAEIDKLIKYIPWLESKKGEDVSGFYEDEELIKNSMTVPVYDSTLLSFVKDAKKTKLIDTNYAYVYSKFRIKNYKDEWKLIESAKITDIYLLKGILSKYVLRGMIKGSVWTEAVENQIFCRVLWKLKELMEFWDGPLS